MCRLKDIDYMDAGSAGMETCGVHQDAGGVGGEGGVSSSVSVGRSSRRCCCRYSQFDAWHECHSVKVGDRHMRRFRTAPMSLVSHLSRIGSREPI